MADEGNIVFKITADIASFISSMQSAKDAMSKDVSDMQKDTETSTKGVMGSLNTMGDSLKESMDKFEGLKNLGKGMKEAGVGITEATAPLDLFTYGSIEAANSFDEATSRIGEKTGLTGKQLDAMGDSLKTAFLTSKQSMGDTADMMALVYQRTGLTGDQLASFTSKMGALAKMSGQDAPTAAQQLTTAFSAWNLTADQSSKYMDAVLTASQKTGVSVGDLTGAVSANAQMFQSMGLNVNQATAMVAQFEKAGMSSSDITGIMTKATQMLTKDQMDAKDALDKGKISLADYNKIMGESSGQYLNDYIDKIKKAGSAEEARQIAVDAFGPKGAKYADLIRTGAMNTDDLTKAMGDNEDAVSKTAEANETATEKFEDMKKTLQEKLIPIGEKFMDVLVKLLPTISSLIDAVGKIVDWFSNLPEPVQKVIVVIGLIVMAAGPFLVILGSLISAFAGIFGAISFVIGGAGLGGLLTALAAVAAPVLAVVAVLAVLVAAFLWLYDNVGWFRDNVNKIIEAFKCDIAVAFDVVTGVLNVFADLLNGNITKAITDFGGMWKNIWNDIKNFMNNIGIAGTVEDIINAAIDAINKFIDGYNKLPGQLQIFGHIDDFGHVTITNVPSTVDTSNASDETKTQINHGGAHQMLASGGIFTQPAFFGGNKTLSIAENEPEAVVPLSKLGSMVGNGKDVVINLVNTIDGAAVGDAVTYRIRLEGGISNV